MTAQLLSMFPMPTAIGVNISVLSEADQAFHHTFLLLDLFTIHPIPLKLQHWNGSGPSISFSDTQSWEDWWATSCERIKKKPKLKNTLPATMVGNVSWSYTGWKEPGILYPNASLNSLCHPSRKPSISPKSWQRERQTDTTPGLIWVVAFFSPLKSIWWKGRKYSVPWLGISQRAVPPRSRAVLQTGEEVIY